MNKRLNPPAQIADLLDVEELDADLYRGAATDGLGGRVFGGQAIAQALAAAGRTVGEDRPAHSLHGYFLRAGDASRPIIFRVERDFDGRSFANRRVVAQQDGKAILNLTASFQHREDGLEHAARMPELPGPEQAMPMRDALQSQGARIPDFIADRFEAFDLVAGGISSGRKNESGLARQHGWFRIPEVFGASAATSRVALAYVSDFGLISTAIVPHKMAFFSPEIQGASLDHALWFHRTPPVGEWLLYLMESPWSGQGRGFARGAIYDRSGQLVADVAQEGLIRYRPARDKDADR
ncbi:acyl-CoA thioesterase II [Novosphingobium sp. PC22D]|uniref:acyl-CoA thioesterase n=1 Tax=Novosphingobium sp. PC22D TaxID=1962403 RepID=UPI000BF17751|nr:acyl-CoA thioesterase II [Novosphingobium sp. PC22D]PEQ13865.1 acyl-CoA thioesterase II [Novosphingobium sp. PC22D]